MTPMLCSRCSAADTEQLEGLRTFKEHVRTRGHLGEFSNVSQLEHEVWKTIEFDIAKLDLGVPVLIRPNNGVPGRLCSIADTPVLSSSKVGAGR